jgi:hypothetical protein
MDEYKTVFEITNKGFDWWFPAVGLGFLALGAILIKVGKVCQWRGFQSATGYFMVAFASLWTLLTFGSTFPEYYEAHKAYRTGQYSVVEGPVENFQPMPYEGHTPECFSVQLQRFCYSEYDVSPGFNNSTSHGGPIKAGLPVRIAYYNQQILRIQIRQTFR